MNHPFPAHGNTRLVLDGAIVRLYVEGPWNMELVRDTHQRLKGTLHANQLDHWALMVVPINSAVCTLDALNTIREAAAREARNDGRVATAWILPAHIEGALIMRSALGKVYSQINPLALFNTEEEAEPWLLERLAESDARS